MSRKSSSNAHVKRRKRKNSKSLTSFLSTDGTAKDSRNNCSNRWTRNNGIEKVSPHDISTSFVSFIRDVACVHRGNMTVLRTATATATVQTTLTLRTTVTTVANRSASSCNSSRAAQALVDIVEGMVYSLASYIIFTLLGIAVFVSNMIVIIIASIMQTPRRDAAPQPEAEANLKARVKQMCR